MDTLTTKINSISDQARKDGIQKLIVGALIFQDNKVLIMRRLSEDFMGGLFEIPSGGVEEGETLEQALYREVEEETGLKVKTISKHIGNFDYCSQNGKRSRQMNFIVEVEDFYEIHLSEHDQYEWVSLNNLDAFHISKEIKNIILNSHESNNDT